MDKLTLAANSSPRQLVQLHGVVSAPTPVQGCVGRQRRNRERCDCRNECHFYVVGKGKRQFYYFLCPLPMARRTSAVLPYESLCFFSFIFWGYFPFSRVYQSRRGQGAVSRRDARHSMRNPKKLVFGGKNVGDFIFFMLDCCTQTRDHCYATCYG